MAVPPRSQRLILPLAPLVAGVIGALTAAMFALVPTDLLESMVVDSGVASVLSAAEPPLGFTARAALVLLCGGGVGLVAWFALFLLFGTRTIVVQRGGHGTVDAPVLRRADAHPDAPARRPLFANTDLGTPFLEVRARAVHVDAAAVAPIAAPPAERPLPDDLDQPLSAFDPAAVPEAPIDWFPPPARLEPAAPQSAPEPTPELVSRRAVFDATERFETFPLTPMVRTVPQPQPQPQPQPAPAPLPIRQTPIVPAPRAIDPSETIGTLLARLERVVSRREAEALSAAPAAPSETIEDTLSSLRRMAMGRR